jgi:hypothetical protein
MVDHQSSGIQKDPKLFRFETSSPGSSGFLAETLSRTRFAGFALTGIAIILILANS